MNISEEKRKAYSEVDEFLELLPEEERNKIPYDVRQLFKKEKDPTYVKGINVDIDIINQNLREETLAIIAMLNLNYWCEDEEERERLEEIYKKNEEKYQDLFQVEFTNDIFKRIQTNTQSSYESETMTENVNTNNEIAVYKKSTFKDILRKIMEFFTKK